MGEIIENEYGKIEVLEKIDSRKVKFKCFCGKIHVSYGSHLRRKLIKSCGCATNSPLRKRKIKEENNFLNKKIGLLTPIEYLNNKNWKCKCDCGNEIITRTDKLKRNKISCGCVGNPVHKFIDYTGKKIGCLIVIGKEKGEQWKSVCECGNIKSTEATVLKNWKHEKCNCKNKIDPIYKNKCYKAWHSAKYKNILSEEFKKLEDFKNYIENELTPPNRDYFICRVNKNKNFEIGNIALKIGPHNAEFNGIKYKFCMGCQRYIQDLSHLFYKTNKSCANCSLKEKLKRKFKLEYSEYIDLIKKCNRRCEICKKDLKFMGKYKTSVIDHCHITGKTRGILCRQCNNGIGLFKDNTNFIKNAINYLERGDTDYKYQKKDNPTIDTICEITGLTENLVCDHNHKTGFIRGNVYNYINLAIGLLKDDKEILRSAIQYLEKERYLND